VRFPGGGGPPPCSQTGPSETRRNVPDPHWTAPDRALRHSQLSRAIHSLANARLRFRTRSRLRRNDNSVDIGSGLRTIDVHGTHTPRRNDAPGNSPVERRRVRGPVGSSREYRQVRRSPVAGAPKVSRPPHNVMRGNFSGFVPVVAPRSPTPTAGGSTSSGPAHTRRTSCLVARILTTAEHRNWGHLAMAPHGSVAPWRRRLAVNQSSSRHRGFNSSLTHPRRRNSEVRVTACRAEGRGFNSRRWRPSSGTSRLRASGTSPVDVAQWRGRRRAKPEVEGLTPSLAAHVLVVQRQEPGHATPATGVRFPPTTPR
jgi:hypothetical protein